MSEQARRYQVQVTGAPEGYVYRVKLGDKYVKFDRYDGSEKELAGALRMLFKEVGLKIEVIHIPPVP